MIEDKKWHVYILECSDKSLYIGATNNIPKRLVEHRKGKGSKYVRSRGAFHLVYSEIHEDKIKALKRERELKGFSRQKKLELIK